jgi:hypothetical protein
MPMDLRLGDVVRLKKQHPCGSFEWEITRLGADIGLRCQGCGRRVMLVRSKAEKRIKAVVRPTVVVGPTLSGHANRQGNDGQTTRD